MRHVGMVTTARSDWGIQRSVAEALRSRDDVRLHIIAGGMHLAPGFGGTATAIEDDGFEIARRLDFLARGDSPLAIARSIGNGIQAFAALFEKWQPDLLTVLGDRFDMYPAAVAATPFLIPVAHMHGGELTVGAFDDALRHSITKLSHLHLVSTPEYARRVLQLGEHPGSVHVVGAPGLDDIVRHEPMPDRSLEAEFGFIPGELNVLVVYHPETRNFERAAPDVAAVLDALDTFEANTVIVRPNADTANQVIHEAIDRYTRAHPTSKAVINVPRQAFLSLMRACSVMIGNSSAGLLEAPSFRIPVVNVGQRQAGRVRALNVIDAPPREAAVHGAIERALDPAFRAALADLENPYGDGHSGPRIARILATAPLGTTIRMKGFHSIELAPAGSEAGVATCKIA